MVVALFGVHVSGAYAASVVGDAASLPDSGSTAQRIIAYTTPSVLLNLLMEWTSWLVNQRIA